MTERLMLMAMLVGIVSLAAVACGGDDEGAAAPPPAAAAAPTGEAAAAAPPPAAAAAPDAVGTVLPPEIAATATTGNIQVSDNRPATAFAADLSTQGDVIDFTVGIREDTVLYGQQRAGVWFEPDEMTFKVGQTVNFTIMPPSDSAKQYTFTAAKFGINERIKYGKPVSFTYTFDKAGRFRFVSTSQQEFGMIGVIVVVE